VLVMIQNGVVHIHKYLKTEEEPTPETSWFYIIF
jgi:hypothetical protein